MRKSPFPGMDPYLETLWPEVHASLIVYARNQLNSQLPSDLQANIDARAKNDALIEELQKPFKERQRLADEWNILRGTNQTEVEAAKKAITALVMPELKPAIERLTFDHKAARQAADQRYDVETRQRYSEATIAALHERAERLRLAIIQIEKLPFVSAAPMADLAKILDGLRSAEFAGLTPEAPAAEATAKGKKKPPVNQDVGEFLGEVHYPKTSTMIG